MLHFFFFESQITLMFDKYLINPTIYDYNGYFEKAIEVSGHFNRNWDN